MDLADLRNVMQVVYQDFFRNFSRQSTQERFVNMIVSAVANAGKFKERHEELKLQVDPGLIPKCKIPIRDWATLCDEVVFFRILWIRSSLR